MRREGAARSAHALAHRGWRLGAVLRAGAVPPSPDCCLTPLIPPPYAHLIRYHGLLAPNARGRDLLPAAPVSWTGIRPEAYVRAKGAVVQETTDEGTRAASLASRPPNSVSPEQPSAKRPPLVHRREEAVGRQEGTGGGHEAGATSMACPMPDRTERPRRRSLPWSELLRRVFGLDVLVCARCGGPMAVIAYISRGRRPGPDRCRGLWDGWGSGMGREGC